MFLDEGLNKDGKVLPSHVRHLVKMRHADDSADLATLGLICADVDPMIERQHLVSFHLDSAKHQRVFCHGCGNTVFGVMLKDSTPIFTFQGLRTFATRLVPSAALLATSPSSASLALLTTATVSLSTLTPTVGASLRGLVLSRFGLRHF